MLVLGRRLGQALMVGEQVEIRILKITDHHVRLGISAPDGVRILREELHLKLLADAADEAAPMSIEPPCRADDDAGHADSPKSARTLLAIRRPPRQTR